MTIPRDPRRAWILLFGPGKRTAALPDLLRAVPTGGEEHRPETIRVLEDLGELLCEFPQSGRLVLDADRIGIEQVGLVRAFLASRAGFTLELFGQDPGSSACRRLCSSPRVRFWASPLDLDALAAFAERPPTPPHAVADAPPSPRRPAVRRNPRPLPEPVSPEPAVADLAGPGVPEEVRREVERILGTPRHPATPSAPPAPEPEPTPRPEPEPAGPRGPAPYFRDQVGDLRDYALRLELGLARLREQAAPALDRAPTAQADALGKGLDDLEADAARLGHFVRTLGYVASPPARGDQRIELAGMVREVLSSAVAGAENPLATELEEELWVRADKSLLALALDALLVLAARCAGSEGRVEARGKRDASGGTVRIELAFPAGPLDGMPFERLFEPYALRRLLPDLGPNALAAAAGIVRGQGGSLLLAPAKGGRLRLALRLPADEGPTVS